MSLKQSMTGKKNIAGKLITLIQLAVSVIRIALIWNSGLAPVKYLVPLIIVLLILFMITHALQYLKNNVSRYLGQIISLLMTIILAVGCVALLKTDDVLKAVGGATYKTDKMVVVVKKDDKADNIMDAENYRFGYQTVVDQKNTKKMVKDVEKVIGRDLKAETYESLTDEANGLLNGDIIVGLPGRFNIYNGMCAACTGALLKMPEEVILHALEHVKVRGRVEYVPTGRGFSVLIDFAHNGVSTESVLKTLRGYNPHRIIAIFGCGGNRSKLRRYEMGEAVGNLAELAIVTSDNPRTEDVMDIVKDMEVGLAKTNGEYVVIPDRQEAVNYAVDHAEDGDMIILLGKGHEEYQEINGVKYHYSEREAVMNALAR